jgi:hypothetical protein
MLVVVEKMEKFLEQRVKMISYGYEWRENYIAPKTQMFYRTSTNGSKTQNIHLCESGSPKEKQFLITRNYFLAFPEKAKEYSDLKERNQLLYPDDYPAYREAKQPFLKQIEKDAYVWDYKKTLESEGFPIIYDWFDEPNTRYEQHIHQGRVSFYVLDGSVNFFGGINKKLSKI